MRCACVEYGNSSTDRLVIVVHTSWLHKHSSEHQANSQEGDGCVGSEMATWNLLKPMEHVLNPHTLAVDNWVEAESNHVTLASYTTVWAEMTTTELLTPMEAVQTPHPEAVDNWVEAECNYQALTS